MPAPGSAPMRRPRPPIARYACSGIGSWSCSTRPRARAKTSRGLPSFAVAGAPFAPARSSARRSALQSADGRAPSRSAGGRRAAIAPPPMPTFLCCPAPLPSLTEGGLVQRCTIDDQGDLSSAFPSPPCATAQLDLIMAAGNQPSRRGRTRSVRWSARRQRDGSGLPGDPARSSCRSPPSAANRAARSCAASQADARSRCFAGAVGADQAQNLAGLEAERHFTRVAGAQHACHGELQGRAGWKLPAARLAGNCSAPGRPRRPCRRIVLAACVRATGQQPARGGTLLKYLGVGSGAD